MEIWDAYNKNFEKIEGKTLVRGKIIPDGLFHLVCDVIVRHIDGTYLLMQRDHKKHFGGMWEATAGGSALQGETPLECAIRELREETGIVSQNLKEAGKIVSPQTHSIYVEFLCVTDQDKDNISLQEGETIAFRWVSRDKLLTMGENELVTKRIWQFISELA